VVLKCLLEVLELIFQGSGRTVVCFRKTLSATVGEDPCLLAWIDTQVPKSNREKILEKQPKHLFNEKPEIHESLE
jgi:hypothetical protein